MCTMYQDLTIGTDRVNWSTLSIHIAEAVAKHSSGTRTVGCSNPSCNRPKLSKQVVRPSTDKCSGKGVSVTGPQR